MNRATIVGEVADATGLTRNEVTAVFEGILDSIAKELANGNTVEIRRFGTFKCVGRAARKAVNPKTGQPIDVEAKTVPVFKPSPILREAVKDVKI